MSRSRSVIEWFCRAACTLLLAVAVGCAPEAQPRELPQIAVSQLPPQAQHTLFLIRAGGPFPYARDGAVFHNREGILPKAPGGYYREYTVQTPGADDRGARRIVAGQRGEFFYTVDHYRTFQRIRE